MDLVKSDGAANWNLTRLSRSPAIKAAARLLKKRVPVISSFKSELLSTYSLSGADGAICTARVWAVRKPQNTRELTEAEIDSVSAAS